MAAPRAFLFDLDGTLYVDGAPVPGAVATLAGLRARGMPFRCVTNTTSRSRAMLRDRLAGYGFDVPAEWIFSATLAGATVARARGFRVVAPFTPTASLEDLAGLTLVGGVTSVPVTARPDAVFLGDLGEAWTYSLLQEAFEYVQGGAELIALSRDRYWRRGDRVALDAGPFVAALEYATGRAAHVAGKPSPEFYAAALTSFEGVVAPGDVAMVGDDLWGDVQGAQRAGLQGWLVRTGKSSATMLEASGIVPDRVIDSVAVLGTAPGD